jgi:hypothetical protein
MFRVFRQVVGGVCWSVTAIVLSGFAVAQVPGKSSAAPADVFSSVHDRLSDAADRTLAASLATQAWMSATNKPPISRAEIPDVQGSPVLKLRAAIHRVEELRPVLEPILREEGLPVELSAVVLVESGGVTTALSPKGARGVWQLMPDTARRYGLKVGVGHDDRTDVVKSTHAASRYLKDLYATFADWSLALAAYNAGELKVMKAMKRGESRDYRSISGGGLLPLETRNYVPAVFGAMNRLQYVTDNLGGPASKHTRVVYAFSGAGE